MAGDDDVDAMLEQALDKDKDQKHASSDVQNGDRKDDGSSKKRDRSKSRDRDKRSDEKKRKRSRSRSREKRKRSRSRSPREKRRSSRSRSRERRRKERERIRERERDRDREEFWAKQRRRTPSPPPRGGRGWSPEDRWADRPVGGRRLPGPERRDVMPFTPRHTPPRNARRDMSVEERDARTVFIMQLSHRTRPRDLEEFFSSVGKVRDVRIITDSKTRRSKGIAYVEFWDVESVPLAIGLNGQKLLNAPLVIQATQAERNRAAHQQVGGVTGFATATPQQGPLRLYVGSLHFNITDDMLRGIFEPFGRIETLQIIKDEQGISRGYGFVTFRNAEDAKRAMDQLNGFELAGRPIKVGHVNEHTGTGAAGRSLDREDMDKAGVDLGTAGRLQLMAKLAEGTGLALPNQAQQVLSMQQQQNMAMSTPAIATQCFMLSNMFDPSKETEENWEQDIRDDVIEECTRNGGVLHIFVDKESPDGNVYVKCPSVASSVASVNSLHGRWFAGKVITANYVPVNNYHQLFPDALKATVPMQPVFTAQPMTGGPANQIY